MPPSLGRIVHYVLSDEDAYKINRRRTTGEEIGALMAAGLWPEGAQAHVGNLVNPGDVLPALVVRVWHEDMVNLQVFLDGNDVYWATSRREAPADYVAEPHGSWFWPARV